MDDLKKAIDELTEKVESLQADLHVANESLKAKQKEIPEMFHTNDQEHTTGGPRR